YRAEHRRERLHGRDRSGPSRQPQRRDQLIIGVRRVRLACVDTLSGGFSLASVPAAFVDLHSAMATKKKISRKVPQAKAKAVSRKSKSARYVYNFGAGKADGNGGMKPLLGGKGANLAEMTRIALPVPPGFTITTEVCTYFYAHKRTYPASLQAEVERGIANMERIMGTKFGDTEKMPLLVAARSGARDSMPGMMDTILNLGLNDETVKALVRATNNERFAWDCYRRFIQMYGDVVMGVQKRAGEDHEPFESVIEHFKD